MDTGPRRLGPTMPTGNELDAYRPVTFAPKDCVSIKFVVKADNKGLGFVGTTSLGGMASNPRFVSFFLYKFMICNE